MDKTDKKGNSKDNSWVFGHQSHIKKSNGHIVHHENHKISNPIIRFYDKQYKKIMIFPILLILVTIALLGFKYATTGEFMNRGVTLKGGLILDIYMPIPVSNDQLQKDIELNFIDSSAQVTTLRTLDGSYQATTIYASDVTGSDLLDFISTKYSISFQGKDNYQMNEVESTFSAMFFKQLIIALIVAFIFMAVTVFIIYKVPVPSIAVILCVCADITETMAILNIMGVTLSSASIAAFIMLIGYSVDTDILLSSKVLRQQNGTVLDRILESIKTGLMMTSTAFVVVVLCYFLTSSAILKEIMLVVMIGLIMDVVNTWLLNTGILRWYLEKKGEHKK
ncbi:MAG: protein translocase subunit SecF [Candidatus Woesearchaeota archaeon]|jgi:preprotein translocase subunit SecF